MLTSPHVARFQSHRVDPKATYIRQQAQRTRPGRHGQTSPRILSALAKRAAALELRKQGRTYREIAAALGLANPGNAHRMIRDELSELREQCRESVTELRDIEAERLDMLWLALMPAVQAGNVQAIRACVAISKRRCALLGLDKANPTQTEGPVKTYVVLDASPDCPDWPDKKPQP